MSDINQNQHPHPATFSHYEWSVCWGQINVFIIVGTSGVVQPAASLGLKAIVRGKAVIEINPEPTMYSERATVFLPARAAQVLPDLIPGYQRQ